MLPPPRSHDLLAVRGALGFVSVASIYAAVRLLPLSDAVALAFLAPLLVAALSPLLLHERPPRGVMFPLALAACGALLVARPASLGGLLPAGVVPDDGAGVAGAGGDAALASSRAGVVAALAHALSTAAAKIAVRRQGVVRQAHYTALCAPPRLLSARHTPPHQPTPCLTTLPWCRCVAWRWQVGRLRRAPSPAPSS